MSIRKGLRFGDDDDVPINPQEYGSTGTKYSNDRLRSQPGKNEFQKEIWNSLLFGGIEAATTQKKIIA